MPLALRPRRGDRARVLAAMLRSLVEELAELNVERHDTEGWTVDADELLDLAKELDRIAEGR